MTTESVKRPVTSDALPLVIQAAFEHPEPTQRAKIHSWLTNWISGLKPRFSEGQIRDVLQQTTGTDIEPFTLSPRDLEIAILATQAAFSERVALTRFRVVSSETLGLHGGLVLTSNLRSYYIERVSWGLRRRTSWKISFVAPAAMPQHKDGRGTVVKAACRLTDSGWQIDVPAACWGDDIDWSALVRNLEVSTFPKSAGRALSSRDLAIHERPDSVRLQTTGAESLMRFTAMAENRTTLVMSSKIKSAATRVFIRLVPHDEEEFALSVIVTQTSRCTRQWAGFWSDVIVPVPTPLRKSIANAFPMHDSWVAPAVIERIS